MKKVEKEVCSVRPNENLGDILDKMLKLQEKEKKPSFLRKTIYVVAAISTVLFVLLVCLSIYKNNFTTESILATLLAFFSIFMSVFFYFKADETSTKFYDSSYKFMKDISVTLGKIEERFGEKLNSLNDKVSHLDRESKEATEEIEDKQEDKDRIINELMEKANLNAEERVRYKKELEDKEEEIAQLQSYRMRAEREATMLRHKIERMPEMNASFDYNTSLNSMRQSSISPKLIETLLETGKLPENLSMRTISMLKKNGYITENGELDIERLLKVRDRIVTEYADDIRRIK